MAGMALIAPVSGRPWRTHHAYVDRLGRLEGHLARVPKRPRDDHCGDRPQHDWLTWLADRHNLSTAAGSPGTAASCRAIRSARLILPIGLTTTCRIIDLS
jgi:hypothetical protein